MLSSEPKQAAAADTVPAGIVWIFVRKADSGIVFAIPESVYPDVVIF